LTKENIDLKTQINMQGEVTKRVEALEMALRELNNELNP